MLNANNADNPRGNENNKEHSCRMYDAIIVGAGLTGLTAALLLHEAGKQVLVLEAADHVGGRASSVPVGASAIETGATWFWANEPLMHQMVERFGVETFPQEISGNALFEANDAPAQRIAGNPLDAPASRFTHGAQSLTEAVAAVLPEVRLGTTVTHVTVQENAAIVTTAGGHVERARHILIALPPALAAESIAFSPELPDNVAGLAANTAVWMGGIVKAVAIFDAPFWHEKGLSGSAMSYVGPFREFHDHSGPAGAPAAIFGFAQAAAFATPSDNAADRTAAIEAAFRAQLARLFGDDAQPRAVHIFDWNANRLAQPRDAFGTTSNFGAAGLREVIHGRVRLASTETSPGFSGHMEGALQSAVLAAKEIFNALEAPSR